MLNFILIIAFILIFSTLFGLSIAPWLPIRKRDLERVNILAELKPGRIFYDLGCGDGRACFYLAKRNPRTKIVGIESVAYLYLFAKIRSLLARYKNVEIKFGDALKENLSGADAIYVFATPHSINHQLKSKFEKELKQNAKVISYSFAIREWQGQSHVDRPDKKSIPIFVYTA